MENYHLVKWRDLQKLSTIETIIENAISLPFLIGCLISLYFNQLIPAIVFGSFFFLAGLRLVHNGFHEALNIPKWGYPLMFHLHSMFMLTSIHAVKYNHLRHHKFCLQEEDYEGKSARMNWYCAILYGPIHYVKIHWVTWKEGKKYRRRMILDWTCISVFVLSIIYFKINWIWWFVAMMITSEFLMAFFAVWTVHHDMHEHPTIARTQRNKWKNRLTFNMFYHLEHHLFPLVPTIKLPELARRIDKVLPELEKKTTW